MPIVRVGIASFVCWMAWLLAGPAAAQEKCRLISFPAGQDTLELSGTAPPEEVNCFAVAGLSDHGVSVVVSEGVNVSFSIEGLVDARDRYRFRATHETYHIVIGQLMRSTEPEPFRIIITLSRAREGR